MEAATVQDHRISAVMLAYNRKPWVEIVLDKLDALPVDEVIVVDHGDDGTSDLVERRRGRARAVRVGHNLGIAGRNLGAAEASGDLLLMLDDDSYPLPGAVERLVAAMDDDPNIAVAGGYVRDVDDDGRPMPRPDLGTFDWFLRAGRNGETPQGGFPAFFYPEGACLMRRDAFLATRGYLEPFFGEVTELELTTRLIGAGWDVRYVPEARFDHMKAPVSRWFERELKLRTRNQIWYFWLHFPPTLATRRIVGYALFDLIQCLSRGALSWWWKGVTEAWRLRSSVRSARDIYPRAVLRRAELNRGRWHIVLLFGHLKARLSR